MCGRFTLLNVFDELVARFGLIYGDNLEYQFRYNIAPSQSVLAVINDGENNRAGMLRWGLVPSFAKDKSIGYKMINARAETIDDKPTFKRLLSRRRCLILADSFYEWRKEGGTKMPMRIQLKDQAPFAFAGLWDRWQSRDGEEINSCTIITTEANELMKDIHHRMPVILPKDSEEIWLDRSIEDKHLLKSLLVPYDAGQMKAHQVSDAVNSARNDSRDCIEALS